MALRPREIIGVRRSRGSVRSAERGLALVVADVAEADEFAALFVEETEAEGAQARPESNRFHLLEEGAGFVATLEIVVRYARAEVMDVVEADVAGEPLQNFRQFVERASFEGGFREIPVLGAFPVDVFELMLDVEKPDACAAGNGENDQLDDQVVNETHAIARKAGD